MAVACTLHPKGRRFYAMVWDTVEETTKAKIKFRQPIKFVFVTDTNLVVVQNNFIRFYDLDQFCLDKKVETKEVQFAFITSTKENTFLLTIHKGSRRWVN